MQSRLFVILFICSLGRTIHAQEFCGDHNLDLYYSQHRVIDDLTLFRTNQANPFQWLGITPSRLYLMSAVQHPEDSSNYRLYYVEQNEWLSIESNLTIHDKISDQEATNKAWIKNKIELQKWLNTQNFYGFDHHFEEKNNSKSITSFWKTPANDYLFYQSDKVLKMITRSNQGKYTTTAYKSKQFPFLTIKAHAFLESKQSIFLMVNLLEQGFIFSPKDNKKFKSEDLSELNQAFNINSTYFFMSWESSTSNDIIELTDSMIYVYPEINSNHYGKKRLIYTHLNAEGWDGHATGDLNNDGRADIFLSGENPVVVFNTTHKSIVFDNHRYDPKGYSLVDVEEDGDLDIVINSYMGLFIFENQGGNFTQKEALKIQRYMDFYFLFDMDKDGDKDFLLKDQFDPYIYMSENVNGQFSQPQIYLTR